MIKIALRNLWKTKGFSFLNIFGLAIGMTCAALILLWVEDELQWDKFQVKRDRLYYVRENQKYDAYTATFSSTPGLLGPAMKAEIPGVANTCRTTEGYQPELFSIGDKSLYLYGKWAEPSLFDMFTFTWVEGNAHSAFSGLNSVVLTQTSARKLFGRVTGIVGRTVRMDQKQDCIVTGVLQDMPTNSDIHFDWVIPFEVYFKASPWLTQWGSNSISTYVELKPGTDAASVNRVLYGFIQKRNQDAIARPFLFSMKDWHLYNDFDNGKQTGRGQITYVQMFNLIAWIILLIACINFMNLSTARSETRAREVGVRKVLGAQRPALIGQFIGESLFMSALAAILATFFVVLLLPVFNSLVQKELVLNLSNPVHLTAWVLVSLVCGLAAGSYPSLYLSGFRPILVLKGLKSKAGSASRIRQGLVVFQFSISLILIISTFVIYQQIQHVQNRSLGFNRKALLELPLEGDMARNYFPLRQDLLNSGYVSDVALSDHSTIYSGNNSDDFTWNGKPPGATILISNRQVTPGFFKTMGIQVLEGRDFRFTDSASVDKKLNIIITKSMERLMGTGGALGKTIREEGDTSGLQAIVVGVVNDYVYGNMYEKNSDPVMFTTTSPVNTTFLYARLREGSPLSKALPVLEAVLKKNNPAYPFNYSFVDDQFQGLISNELLIGKLSRLFAALAILISCLGLFGLAAYTAERRTKEIGIRKVLGAGVGRIVALLSGDFLRLVGIAVLIAFPVAGWIMHRWLQNYTYRVALHWYIFLGAGVLTCLIALITIGFQALRAASANPVQSLRSE